MQHCINCNCKSYLFNFLTDEELEIINKNRFVVQFNTGELIFKQGTPNTHVISFTQGFAKLYIEGQYGKNAILRIIKPTEFISGGGLFVDNRHHYSVTALIPSKACFIKASIMKEMIDRNKIFAHKYMGELNKKLISSYDKLINNYEKNREGRIATILLYLKEEIFNTNPYPLTLSKQELSEFTGMSKESVFKIIKEFNDAGFIKNGGDTVEIVNYKSLHKIAMNG